MCCKINANNFSINVKTLKRFNIILTFCVMYTVYGLFFCTCAEISGQKYYLLKRSVSDEINIIEFCMISRPRFFPPESPYANIFQQANTKNPTLFSRQLSHPRVYVWCLGLGHIFSSLCRCNERKAPPNFAFTTNTTWLMTCRDAP